jgi:hypothetical protein
MPTFRNIRPNQSVILFLGGNSPASRFYVPTFRNTQYVPPMKMEHTEFYETSVYKIQTQGNHPQKKEYNIQNMANFLNKKN